MRRSFFLFWFLTLSIYSLAMGEEGRVYVIVNNANPVASMEAKDLSKLFLKKSVQWPNGQQVLPVDQPENSPAMEGFSKEVHGKTPASIKSYWQQQIFSGRNVPPPEKGSDAEVVSYVKSNPNAVGYVSSQPSESGVKLLKVIH